MIQLAEIKRAIIHKLSTKYTKDKYKFYGMEITEGYKKPSFFVDLRLTKAEDATANIKEKQVSVYITYLQKEKNEMDNLQKVDEIQELFCEVDHKNRLRKMTLKVNKRYLKIGNYSFDYTGQENNILQIEFDIEFFEFDERSETWQIANNVELKMEGVR